MNICILPYETTTASKLKFKDDDIMIPFTIADNEGIGDCKSLLLLSAPAPDRRHADMDTLSRCKMSAICNLNQTI